MTTATSRCCHLSTKSLTIIEIIMFRIFFSSSVSLNHTTHLSIISRSNDLSSLVENHLVKFLFSNWFVFCSNPRINSAQNSSLKLSHESFKEDKIFACVTIFVKIIRRGDSGISIIRTIIFDPYSIRKTRLDCSRREWCISRIGDFFFFFETNFEDEVENLYRVALFACFETRIISEFWLSLQFSLSEKKFDIYSPVGDQFPPFSFSYPYKW